MGGECLKAKKAEARAACWERAGKELEKHGAMEACGPALEPVKAELMKAEQAKYPKQDHVFK